MSVQSCISSAVVASGLLLMRDCKGEFALERLSSESHCTHALQPGANLSGGELYQFRAYNQT